MSVDVFKTNSFVFAQDATDVLITITNDLFPDEILGLLSYGVGGNAVHKFADFLERRTAEGLDANHNLLYRYYHMGGSLGLMKMLIMDVEESNIEELRAFHDGKVSAAMEMRKAILTESNGRSFQQMIDYGPSLPQAPYSSYPSDFEEGPTDPPNLGSPAPGPGIVSGGSIMDLFD